MFTDNRSSQPVAYSYPLRSSTALLFFQIFVTQVSLIFLTLIVHLSLDSLSRATSFNWSLDVLQLVFILVFQVGAVIFAFIAFLRWIHTVYSIQPDRIIKKQGIINLEEEIYSTDPIVEVMVKQSWLGRLLRYGTLEITNPLLRQNYYLSNIPHPFFYASVIQETERPLTNQEVRYYPLPDSQDVDTSPRITGNLTLSGDS